MTEQLKVKLLETKTLICGGAVVLLFTVLSQMASWILYTNQAIPCILFLGQPKMPGSMVRALEEKDNLE